MILGPPSNQVSCTPNRPTATHLVAAQNTVFGTPTVIAIPLSDAIAGTGDWEQLVELEEVASAGFTFDLKNRLLFVAKGSTNGGIWKMNMAGTGLEKIYTKAPNGFGITCNPSTQKVYFRHGLSPFQNANELWEIGYDGTGEAQVSSSKPTNAPWYDEVNDWIYVQDASNDVIRRVRSDGTDEEVWRDDVEPGAGGQLHGDGTLGKLFRFDTTPSVGLYETDIATKADTLLAANVGTAGIVYDAGTDKVFALQGGTSTGLKVWDRETEMLSDGRQVPSSHYDLLGLAIIE